MRKSFGAVCLILLLSAGSARQLAGCGDKFLSVATGTRFQRAPVGQQEAILIYAAPASDVAAAMKHLSLETALRGSGYRPTVVSSRSELEARLGDQKWDLLLISLADVASAAPYVGEATGILPVVLGASRSESKAAQNRFKVVLTKVVNSYGLARAVSAALSSRSSVTAD